MEIRVITVGGEYGSGRAEIAEQVAARLGWRLVDNCLIQDIAQAADVDPEVARRFDERTDPWLHRLRKALWHGGYEGVATTTEAGFDADAMAEAARRVIEEAASQGRCVIVGRGAQCVLQDRPDVFHVFVYAPRERRVERVRRREKPGVDADALVEEWDRRRQNYARRYFGQEWNNYHLFDLMLSSTMGEEAAAAAILTAVARRGF